MNSSFNQSHNECIYGIAKQSVSTLKYRKGTISHVLFTLLIRPGEFQKLEIYPRMQEFKDYSTYTRRDVFLQGVQRQNENKWPEHTSTMNRPLQTT